jgi:dipeptidyl aminopeptidase/acylaminoacyl peptidase
MLKLLIISFLIMIFLASGCGSAAPVVIGTPPTAPPPATATQGLAYAEVSPTPEADAEPGQVAAAPIGLHVVYLHEGNLWSWTEAQGNVLLTDTKDISTIRLSEDGQYLVFMRGRDVWTVRMDGTDARLVATKKDKGAALWYAPNGILLAISTTDHIEVINLKTATLTPVVTYPAIPDGYYPEIVWSADSSGFKTVIPPASEEDRAQFLYVFPDGNVASLAKFAMLPPAVAPPFISPDGGYVIFVSQLSDGKESLSLMDSSGAARPYGQPGEKVHAYGWLPDSKKFVYTDDREQMFLGNATGEPPEAIMFGGFQAIRWVDDKCFLALQDGNLYLGDIQGGKSLIAEDVSSFDFEK